MSGRTTPKNRAAGSVGVPRAASVSGAPVANRSLTDAVRTGATPTTRVTRGPRSDSGWAAQVSGAPAFQSSKQTSRIQDRSSLEIRQRRAAADSGVLPTAQAAPSIVPWDTG